MLYGKTVLILGYGSIGEHVAQVCQALGMEIIAIPVLEGWQWATLISPVFVAFLLTKVSGVPMLEKAADERWGGQDDYEAYKRNTSVLVMKPPARDRS